MHRCGLYPAHSSDVLPPRAMVGRAGRVASEAVYAWAIPDIAGRVRRAVKLKMWQYKGWMASISGP